MGLVKIQRVGKEVPGTIRMLGRDLARPLDENTHDEPP
jgi:hypothetical protein